MFAAKSVVLKEPFESGIPGPEHFSVEESVVLSSLVEDGSILVELSAISADPYLRNTIKVSGSVKAGEPLVGFVVGRVIAVKRNSLWNVGDFFGGNLPFVTIQSLTVEAINAGLLWKLTDLLSEDDLSLGLGILGMPGATAYGGLIDILRPLRGETIFVSAASGAVGSLVGMLAKNVFGCVVIGSCGGPEKCALIKEKFGYDYAIDYKTLNSKEELKAALHAVAPQGIDMYFENVGGFHFEAAFESLRPLGRIAICGGISQYNDTRATPISVDPMQACYRRQRIEGFLAWDWLDGSRGGNFLPDMHKYLQEGKVVPQETVFQGLESYGEALQSLFTGKNLGKVVVRI